MSDEQRSIKKCEHGYPKSMWCPKRKGESELSVRTDSDFSLEDAKTILGLEYVSDGEGQGPDSSKLLLQIAEQYPELVKEHPEIRWPNNSGSATAESRSL